MTGLGETNALQRTAGLDPTNHASVFVLQIVRVNGQPNQKNPMDNPITPGRTYTVESRTNLVSGGHAAPVIMSGPTTNVTAATVTDLNAAQPAKLYHIKITYP